MPASSGSTGIPPAPAKVRTGDLRAREELRHRLEALGFDDVRFAAVTGPLDDPLRSWIAAGMHGDMQWMERTVDKRLDPDLVLRGARSVIMLGVSYWSEALRYGAPPTSAAANRQTSRDQSVDTNAAVTPAAGSTLPRWARYALHEDYHDTMKRGLIAAGRVLEELHGVSEQDYRYYVDTGPVLERSWAARAGLGFTGKNAMLISQRHGNWLFLAAILTRIEFAPDEPVRNRFHDRDVGVLCGSCTRCLTACPTNAFAAPGVVDARRCISYQTIENKGVIPRELRAGIGNRIYGCDVCLEVCPWNRFAREGRQILLAARYNVAALTLEEILALTPERFAEVFRRTPIKRLKLVGLLRNACVVAGNAGDASLRPPLVRLATTHESELVRAHAVWAAFRLGAGVELRGAREQETDPIVLAEYAAEQDAAA